MKLPRLTQLCVRLTVWHLNYDQTNYLITAKTHQHFSFPRGIRFSYQTCRQQCACSIITEFSQSSAKAPYQFWWTRLRGDNYKTEREAWWMCISDICLRTALYRRAVGKWSGRTGRVSWGFEILEYIRHVHSEGFLDGQSAWTKQMWFQPKPYPWTKGFLPFLTPSPRASEIWTKIQNGPKVRWSKTFSRYNRNVQVLNLLTNVPSQVQALILVQLLQSNNFCRLNK